MATIVPKPLFFALLCGFAVLFLYHRSSTTTSDMASYESADATAWSSKLEGWRQRASPADASALRATEDNLVFAAIYSAPVDPEGFTLALFEPDVAVDASGQVLRLIREDFDGLKKLAGEVAQLPETGEFRNQWRVRWPMTSRPIDRILIKTGGELKETSVYGWAKDRRALEKKVGETSELPAPLYELVGVVREGREGYEKGKEQKNVVDSVKALLGDAL